MLFYPESFKVSTPTDREVQIVRDFQAPRALLFDAFTKPELVRRWLLGPDGWTMPVCEIDPRAGGAYPKELSRPRSSMSHGIRVKQSLLRCLRTEERRRESQSSCFMSRRKLVIPRHGPAWNAGWLPATAVWRISCNPCWRKWKLRC